MNENPKHTHIALVAYLVIVAGGLAAIAIVLITNGGVA